MEIIQLGAERNTILTKSWHTILELRGTCCTFIYVILVCFYVFKRKHAVLLTLCCWVESISERTRRYFRRPGLCAYIYPIYVYRNTSYNICTSAKMQIIRKLLFFFVYSSVDGPFNPASEYHHSCSSVSRDQCHVYSEKRQSQMRTNMDRERKPVHQSYERNWRHDVGWRSDVTEHCHVECVVEGQRGVNEMLCRLFQVWKERHRVRNSSPR